MSEDTYGQQELERIEDGGLEKQWLSQRRNTTRNSLNEAQAIPFQRQDQKC
jgi:hypothetical protein